MSAFISSGSVPPCKHTVHRDLSSYTHYSFILKLVDQMIYLKPIKMGYLSHFGISKTTHPACDS